VRKAEVFRQKQGIDVRTAHAVDRIERSGKTVSGTTPDGTAFEAPYDKLLIATGADPVMPEVPGIDLPGVTVLKNLEDGRRIKRFLSEKAVRHVVIVGMGYVALEMAESLRELDLAVSMVKPNPRFLPWLEETLAGVVYREIEEKGVQLHAGCTLERIEPAADRLKVMCAGMETNCDMVLAAVGVTPNSQLAKQAGLALGPAEAIAVDRRMQTSDADIYAAGDCADAYHVVTGGKTWIPLALRANRAGWAAADAVCGRPVELQGVAGTAVFRVFELQVARTGLNLAEAAQAGFDPVENWIESRSRAHSQAGAAGIWVNLVGDRKSGRLLGAQMVGREGVAHRINAPAVALHARMTVEQFYQTDLAYAPPFGPTWDPCLTAANQLLKKL
jgi:NADPH-dependent 2,4-dienoyl-CoA reductase/sulfur reductase-like enzyme